MITRLLLPLGLLSISLGIFALYAGAPGYPVLLVAAGGIVLARLCLAPAPGPSDSPPAGEHRPSDFVMPAVPPCPEERLRQARALAARVVQASNAETIHDHHRS